MTFLHCISESRDPLVSAATLFHTQELCTDRVYDATANHGRTPRTTAKARAGLWQYLFAAYNTHKKSHQ